MTFLPSFPRPTIYQWQCSLKHCCRLLFLPTSSLFISLTSSCFSRFFPLPVAYANFALLLLSSVSHDLLWNFCLGFFEKQTEKSPQAYFPFYGVHRSCQNLGNDLQLFSLIEFGFTACLFVLLSLELYSRIWLANLHSLMQGSLLRSNCKHGARPA